MIPAYIRAAAVDDNEDHLQKVCWGLGKAGLSAIPFLFEDGRLEQEPTEPIQGVRIVFTDIHLVGGGLNNEKTHAANIIRCLKKIIAPGPYILVFWSQFPDDSTKIQALIDLDGPGAKLVPPVGYASIDKNLIFDVERTEGNDNFNVSALRDRIVETLRSFKTLATALSWEDRTSRAAARTTDRLFLLGNALNDRLGTWQGLLAFLACEAAGRTQAQRDLRATLDAALLPLLEDQLATIASSVQADEGDLEPLLQLISARARTECPEGISLSQLNSSYLIDETSMDRNPAMWDRGMVSELGGAYLNSGEFIRAFGREKGDLISREFIFGSPDDGVLTKLKLHIVALDAECDHVQDKIATRRYLLALLVPDSLLSLCVAKSKNGGTVRYKNDSVMDIGNIVLQASPAEDMHLLISTRCYMSLAPEKSVDARCRFRLRRLLLEEVMHRYTTHARRPGVLRF